MPLAAPPRRPVAARGFTVVELMTTIAILAILAAIAIPSFTEIINNNRLAGASNDLMASLQTSRHEAIRRGFRVYVCPSTNTTTCTTGVSWSTGWISFIDLNADTNLSAGELLRSERFAAPLQVMTSNNISGASRIVFRPDGFAYSNGGTLLSANLAVCMPTNRPLQNVRDVSIVAGSRMSVARRNGGGACGAPGNP